MNDSFVKYITSRKQILDCCFHIVIMRKLKNIQNVEKFLGVVHWLTSDLRHSPPGAGGSVGPVSL